MKLKLLCDDGFWQVYKRHPGKLGGSGRARGARISFLTHPSDRGKFLRWSRGKAGGKRAPKRP
jgi:hypothetical protein